MGIARALATTIAASALVVAAAPAALAHDLGLSGREHVEEDAVVLTHKQERRFDRRTRRMSRTVPRRASRCQPAARRPVGPGDRLAGRRRARGAVAERQGARLRLGRRRGNRDLPGARSHAGDGLGSRDRDADVGARQRLQHLLQRPRSSRQRRAVRRRRQQERPARGDRPDARLQPGRQHLDARPGHGRRALVSERHAAGKRRDADHRGRPRHARGPQDRRRPALAQRRGARSAALSVAGRRPRRPRLLLGPEQRDAGAQHERERVVAEPRRARRRRPLLRRPRAL